MTLRLSRGPSFPHDPPWDQVKVSFQSGAWEREGKAKAWEQGERNRHCMDIYFSPPEWIGCHSRGDFPPLVTTQERGNEKRRQEAGASGQVCSQAGAWEQEERRHERGMIKFLSRPGAMPLDPSLTQCRVQTARPGLCPTAPPASARGAVRPKSLPGSLGSPADLKAGQQAGTRRRCPGCPGRPSSDPRSGST